VRERKAGLETLLKDAPTGVHLSEHGHPSQRDPPGRARRLPAWGRRSGPPGSSGGEGHVGAVQFSRLIVRSEGAPAAAERSRDGGQSAPLPHLLRRPGVKQPPSDAKPLTHFCVTWAGANAPWSPPRPSARDWAATARAKGQSCPLIAKSPSMRRPGRPSLHLAQRRQTNKLVVRWGWF
jgi:hypothetical protein